MCVVIVRLGPSQKLNISTVNYRSRYSNTEVYINKQVQYWSIVLEDHLVQTVCKALSTLLRRGNYNLGSNVHCFCGGFQYFHIISSSGSLD